MSIGASIKNYRVSKNLTQEQLAEKIGVSRQAVTKWEMNKTAPSTDNLIRLGEIFQVSIDEIINWEDSSIEKERPSKPIVKILLILWFFVLIFFLWTSNLGVAGLIGAFILWINYSIIILFIYIIILVIKSLKKYIGRI